MAAIEHLAATTDFSSNSSLVIDRAFLIARRIGARLSVVHVVAIDTLAPMRKLLGAEFENVSQRVLDEASKRLAEFVGDSPVQNEVPVNLHIARGSASSAIAAFSDREDVDLVLLGAHGTGFMHRVLLGSTASRVLRKSMSPVLVVKQEAHHAYKRVLVTIDLSPGSVAAIRVARNVAPDAEYVLLHALETPFEGNMQYAGVSEKVIHQYRIEARTLAMQQLQEVAESADLPAGKYTGLVVRGNTALKILEQEERERCDLVVMGKHGTHVTEDLLLGSVTRRVLADSRSDVLVVPDKSHPDVLRVAP